MRATTSAVSGRGNSSSGRGAVGALVAASSSPASAQGSADPGIAGLLGTLRNMAFAGVEPAHGTGTQALLQPIDQPGEAVGRGLVSPMPSAT